MSGTETHSDAQRTGGGYETGASEENGLELNIWK